MSASVSECVSVSVSVSVCVSGETDDVLHVLVSGVARQVSLYRGVT